MALPATYKSPDINRAFHLTEAFIRLRSYTMRQIDEAAKQVSDSDVESFRKIIDMLNK